MDRQDTATVASPLRAAGLTDTGCVRDRNEDTLLVDVEGGLFIVADGIGGRAGGGIASHIVIESLPRILRHRMEITASTATRNDDRLRKALKEGMSELSRHIYEGSKDNAEYKDMGAAAVVVYVVGNGAHVAHMGDSRAYLLRDGALRQITDDHSLVSLLLRRREITAQEAEDHPARGHLTRFVGMEAAVDPDVQSVVLQSGDRMLLCTDGLWGMLTQAKLCELLNANTDARTTCHALMAAAKLAGGKDNLTAVVVDV